MTTPSVLPEPARCWRQRWRWLLPRSAASCFTARSIQLANGALRVPWLEIIEEIAVYGDTSVEKVRRCHRLRSPPDEYYCQRMAVPLDTSVAAAELHEEAYRKLGHAGRLRIALDLSDFTHSLAVAEIRRRHPGCSDEDARRRLAALLYDSD